MSVAEGATPDPLTPADCDLRGMAFMPLDVSRLIDSDLFALSTGDEFKAAVALWCKSWGQVPAASLPDDDRILAHLSGAGHAAWCDLSRDIVLRGWVKCSDGRLYHPVVAEKALEALPRRRDYQDRKTNDADRKARERQDRKALFSALKVKGISCDFNTKTSVLRQMAAQHDVTLPVTGPVTDVTTPVTGPVTAKTGRGTETETDNSLPSGERAAAPRRAAPTKGSRLPRDWSLPRDWRDWSAKEFGWDERRITTVAEGFRDYWWGKAGKEAVKADWLATWRSWCRREGKGSFGGRSQNDDGWQIGGTRMSSPC